jgi:hypothetical protein
MREDARLGLIAVIGALVLFARKPARLLAKIS